MFSIDEEKTYHIKESEFDEAKVLDFFESEKGANKRYKFALHDDDDGRLLGVIGYNDIVAKRELFPVIFHHSRDIFQEVNAYLMAHGGEGGIGYKQCVSVVDDGGELLYALKWQIQAEKVHFKLPTGRRCRFYPSFLEWRLDEKCLDLTLLETADVFVFEEFAEYTYGAAEVIRKHAPEAIIIFIDPAAGFFYSEEDKKRVKLFSRLQVKRYLGKHPEYRVMYITKEDNRISADVSLFMNVMTTKMLFLNLFWASLYEKTRSFDEIEYMVMDIDQESVAGLKAIMDDCLQINYFTARRGLEAAYTHWNYNMYSEESISRYFDLDVDFHFDPTGKEGHILYVDMQGYLYLTTLVRRTYYRTDWQYVIDEDFMEELDRTVASILPAGKRILGVVNRGTDYTEKKPTGHPIQADPEPMIARAERMMRYDHYEYLYLATEDEDIFEMYKAAFGDRLLSFNQERYEKSQFENADIIADLVSERSDREKEKQMTDYFKVVYVLSKCTSLLASGACGAATMVQELNRGKYEDVFIYNLGRYGF